MPDSEERVTLKMAGIGERRFAVDSTATAQELCDALDSEYPKLSDAGGFELLRAEEGCPKDLTVIPMPNGGYTVEYLKAIVHNAKIYIRPLQTDLSLEPSTSNVSLGSCTFGNSIVYIICASTEFFPATRGDMQEVWQFDSGFRPQETPPELWQV